MVYSGKKGIREMKIWNNQTKDALRKNEETANATELPPKLRQKKSIYPATETRERITL